MNEKNHPVIQEDTMYNTSIDNMTAAQVWAAWKAQELTAGDLADWQQRHKIYFDQEGKTNA